MRLGLVCSIRFSATIVLKKLIDGQAQGNRDSKLTTHYICISLPTI